MQRPSFTPGPYRAVGSSIYANTPQDVDPNRFKGFTEIELGHGYLIAESTPHKPTRDLLAAAPEMYDFIDTLENDDGKLPAWFWEWRNALLANARGEVA